MCGDTEERKRSDEKKNDGTETSEYSRHCGKRFLNDHFPSRHYLESRGEPYTSLTTDSLRARQRIIFSQSERIDGARKIFRTPRKKISCARKKFRNRAAQSEVRATRRVRRPANPQAYTYTRTPSGYFVFKKHPALTDRFRFSERNTERGREKVCVRSAARGN